MDWKNIDKSKTVRGVIAGIAIVVVLVATFEAGVFVGFKKAAFSSRFADNYYRAFAPHTNLMQISDADDLPASYGAAGKIMSVNLPEIIVADRNNVEKTVLISEGTIIKEFRGDASSSSIKAGDYAVILGIPNDKSQIDAKLIRILPPPEEDATNTSN